MTATGRTALVTGAGSGIGRAIAKRLATDGARVVAADINLAAAEDVAADLPGDAVAIAVDVADEASVQQAVDHIDRTCGRLDVLVNNAGITDDNFLHKMTLDQWQHVLGVNLTGPFLCTRAAAAVMRRNGYGRVVNVSSVAGVHGALTCANYCASKAGLLGLTVATAREFGRYVARESVDMTCNAVMPGIVDTRLSAVMPEALRQQRVADTPLARFGEPADVADAVAFLASDDARFVTGTSLRVDGGWRMAAG